MSHLRGLFYSKFLNRILVSMIVRKGWSTFNSVDDEWCVVQTTNSSLSNS